MMGRTGGTGWTGGANGAIFGALLQVMVPRDALVVVHEPAALVRLVPAQATIDLQWKGYAPSAEYRRVLEEALIAVKQNGVRSWLADLREMGAILHNDEIWTARDWMPRLATTGLERMAIVTSTDFFNQMSTDRIMDAIELPFEVAYFDDRVPAEAWLKAQGERR